VRKAPWAMLGWTALWIVAVWAIDPAATVGGKPPSWVLFELWALGFILLGAVWARLLTVDDSGRARVDLRPLRSIRGAGLAWTALWMVLLVIWALDPAPSAVGEGPGLTGLGDLKPSEPVLYALWAVGIVLLGAAWLVARVWGAGRRRSWGQ
jgi:hypothetical protein